MLIGIARSKFFGEEGIGENICLVLVGLFLNFVE